LKTKPRLPVDAQLDQSFRLSDGRWVSASLGVRLTGVAPTYSAVEQDVAGFLARCDGRVPLSELASALAAQVKVDPDVVRKQCCAIIRTLAGRRIVHLLS